MKIRGKRFSKKATSSIETVVSITLFIIFVFLLILAFPLTRIEKNQDSLDTATERIINFTSTQIIRFSVLVNNSEIGTCFSADPNLSISNIIAKNKDNIIINATHADSTMYLQGTENFYYIYSSPELEERVFNLTSCDVLDSGNFEVSIIRKHVAISYNKAAELNTSYYSNYNSLHSQLNIPETQDFGFIIRETNGTEVIRSLKETPRKTSIFVKQTPIQVIYPGRIPEHSWLEVHIW